MAFQVFTDGSGASIPGKMAFNGHYQQSNGFTEGWFEWGYTSIIFSTAAQALPAGDGTYRQSGVTVNKDSIVLSRAAGTGGSVGSQTSFKTLADDAVFTSGLTPGTPTKTACPCSGSVNVNTVLSGGTVVIQYRVKGTSTWSNGPTVASGISGTPGTTALGGTLSALTPGTIYEARYQLTRDTTNAQILVSNIATFTTQASVAVVLEPSVMELTVNMLTPTLVGTILTSPLMSIELEMPTPLVFIAATRVHDIIVTMAGAGEIEVVMS